MTPPADRDAAPAGALGDSSPATVPVAMSRVGAAAQPPDATAQQAASPPSARPPGQAPPGLALLHPVRGVDQAIVDFAYSYLNSTGAQLLGAAAGDRVSQPPDRDLLPGGTETPWTTYARVLHTGTPEDQELRYRLGGADVVLHLSVVRVGDAIAVTCCDVSWRVGTNAERVGVATGAASATPQEAQILEQVRDGHVTLDRTWKIQSVNAAAARFFGRSPGTLLGQEFWTVAPWIVDTDAGRMCQRVLRSGDEGHCTLEVGAEGGRRHVEIDAYPTDEGGVAMFWRDITPRVHADAFQREFAAHLALWNQQLQANAAERERLLAAAEAARADAETARAEAEQARSDAEKANRAKSEFLTTMSHELRTPLNAIGGYAELMALGIRGPVTAAQLEDLARIERSQRHLLGLINEVLNFARLEATTIVYATEDVPVRDALATVAEFVEPQARARTIALTFGDSTPELAVRADREKLRQVLLNLLSNAVKFTNEGGAISARGSARDEYVAIEITDNGIGIPSTRLQSVFEPFVQVETGLSRSSQGVGLGLAISRALARGMGGDLTVESELGHGSTFTLLLPRAGA